MNPEELNQLIDALIDGDISEADFVRLEAEFHVNDDARKAYYERLKLSTLLEIESENAAEPSNVIEVPRARFQWSRIAAIPAAVIIICASALMGWFAGHDPQKGQALKPAEPVAAGFGVVAEEAEAVWEDGQSMGRGDLVPGGELKLASGTVQLDLFSGATVVIEGKATFELVSAMVMKVREGRVRAIVPEEAQGFRITTDAGDLVDLGTEFAINVGADHADLHVLDGEVEWHPTASKVRLMKRGEAVRFSPDGKATPLELEPRSMADVEKSFAERRNQRHRAWLRHVAHQKQDPRLVAYYPMIDQTLSPRTLGDQSSSGHDATIVRAAPTTDRWGTPKAALDFSPTGSRARVVIPGEFRSLTFICWAKIDSLDRWYNSLFLTDGHELNEPHWQIMDDGRLFFSVKKQEWKSKKDPDKHVFYSPRFWNHSMSGRWIQIATVYDVEAETVTHYVDGKPISNEKVPEGYLVEKVTIGAASIGNWSQPRHRTDPHFAVRNLNGTIDEFAIYSVAMTADEIEELYKVGKP